MPFLRPKGPQYPETAAFTEYRGCPLCTADRVADERFFAWFLAENYLSPETRRRLVAAWGFCARHTRTFAQRAGASTLTYVYAYLARAAAAECARAVHGLGRRGRSPVHGLAAPCPVCADMARHRHRTFGLWVRREVRRCDEESAAKAFAPLCLCHLSEQAPANPEGVRRAAQLLSAELAEVKGNPKGTLEWIWGRPGGGDEPATAEDPYAELRRLAEWASLEGLRAELLEQACPLCRAEWATELAYRAWLGEAIADGSELDQAAWLCAEHGWAVVEASSEPGSALLAETLLEYWTVRLEQLAVAPAGWANRAWRRRSLQEHVLRRYRCPLCRALDRTADRWANLIVRSLGDEACRAAYARSGGVCLHHLPLVWGRAGQWERELVARTAHVHLDVLAWRLEEYHRKTDWHARWEPPGAEAVAWREAAARFNGRR